MKHLLITAAAVILGFSHPAFIKAETDFYSGGTPYETAEEITGEMNNTELLGQVFMLGFFGTTPSRSIISWITEKNIGGVKIFGWNVADLATLGKTIGEFQKYSSRSRFRIPLFIATDQEGGWVRHIKGKTSITPGNLSIGATELPYDAYKTGYYIGQELRLLGINMNFAPTVDVYTNPEADVIGPRSFSHDPVETAELSVAFYKGLEESRVISTAKHFPGHGNVTQDSHGTLPVIDTTMDVMWNRELLPYRYLIKRDIPAIMSGHLAYPSVTGKVVPASLSPYFLTDLLKRKMGFKGIIITDDMRMAGAVSRTKNTAEACMDAIEAGNDLIMISHGSDIYEQVWNKLYSRMKTDSGFKDRIKDAVKRILYVKLKYLKGTDRVPLYPDTERIKKEIPSEEAKTFFFSEACRSVTMIRDKDLPLKKDKTGKILIAGPYHQFLSTGREYFPEADTFYFPFAPQKDRILLYREKLSDIAGSYDTVIFSMANRESVEILSGLKGSGARVIVVSSLTPVYLKDIPWIKSAIAVYGTGIESFTAGFSVIRGDFKPEGRLPIPLDTDWNG